MKRLLFTITLLLTISFTYAQNQKYQLSSHILDIATGKPAAEVSIRLEKLNSDKKWEPLNTLITDSNGRVTNFLPYEQKDNQGIYKLIFETLPYFKNRNIDTFYPFIEVVFTIKGEGHFHVPITISPFGYSTYKGS